MGHDEGGGVVGDKGEWAAAGADPSASGESEGASKSMASKRQLELLLLCPLPVS